jgi:hypothetical protein
MPALWRRERGDDVRPEYEDGPITAFYRALYMYSDPDTPDVFPYREYIDWRPGPTQPQWNEWANCEDDCPGDDYLEGVGYDPKDFVLDTLQNYFEEFRSIEQENYENLINSWRTWVEWFYQEAGDNGSFYAAFDAMVNDEGGMYDWQYELLNIQPRLPMCTPEMDNFPCRNENGITIDADPDDEWDEVDSLITEGMAFREACAELYEAFISAEVDASVGFNPAVYHWTDNIGGAHTVTVEANDFVFPYIHQCDKTGNWFVNEQCWELRDYNDNARITVTREDPPEREVSSLLGFWKAGTINRASTVRWGVNNSNQVFVETQSTAQ